MLYLLHLLVFCQSILKNVTNSWHFNFKYLIIHLFLEKDIVITPLSHLTSLTFFENNLSHLYFFFEWWICFTQINIPKEEKCAQVCLQIHSCQAVSFLLTAANFMYDGTTIYMTGFLLMDICVFPTFSIIKEAVMSVLVLA